MQFKPWIEMMCNIAFLLFLVIAITYLNIWMFVFGIILLVILFVIISFFTTRNNPIEIKDNDPELVWQRNQKK